MRTDATLRAGTGGGAGPRSASGQGERREQKPAPENPGAPHRSPDP